MCGKLEVDGSRQSRGKPKMVYDTTLTPFAATFPHFFMNNFRVKTRVKSTYTL
jgi:hypothetical protein